MDELDLEGLTSGSDESEHIDFFPTDYRIGRTKYIFVTGGVMSGVGKGVFSASLGHLLQHYGFSVTQIKVDGYLNYDAGTLNPYRHGEVFVLEDGTECDMDLGNYERFLDSNLDCDNYITSGKVYSIILGKERRGEYLGRDVQVVPHVTGEIKYLVRSKAHQGPYDLVVVEIGGTIGDIENLHFVEAAREMLHDEGKENVMFAHLTVVPYNKATGEQKSKPTQHSVKKLLELGIQPDIIVCRSAQRLAEKVRQKISLFCNVPTRHVINSPDADSIYKIPHLLDQQKVAQITAEMLHLNLPWGNHRTSPYSIYLEHARRKNRSLQIAITGKYTALQDSYISIINALWHVEPQEGVDIQIKWIDTTEIEGNGKLDRRLLQDVQGIIVPGGFGGRGTEGKIHCIQFARENNIPLLGLCYGFQLAVVEWARHVCNLEGAHSMEVEPKTPHPVIYLLPEQKAISGLGGSMRLGGQKVKLQRGTLTHRLYQKDEVVERFRHRWEFNLDYKKTVEEVGMVFSGTTPDKKIMQVLEIPSRRFFIATQFHPELTSRPLSPHPLFLGFIRAAKTI